MILQHLVFPGSDLEGTELLYSTSQNIKFPLSLKSGDSVDFFGYFNYLSLDKWCKYLETEDIFLEIEGIGDFDVEFCVFCEGTKTVSEHQFVHVSESIKLSIPNITKGLLGLRFIAFSDVILSSASYVCDSKLFPNIYIGINVCTYHREEFIDRKVKAFLTALSNNSCLIDHMVLFVVDNGSTIPVDKYDSKYIHVLPHENTGGSGGFTYGINVISDTNLFTHILMMDDDTVIDPETLYRTWSFLSVSYSIDPNIILGGMMFSLEDVCKVVEGSSYFKNGRLYPNKKDLDCSSLTGCLDAIREDEANYNGWWYCVYPVSYANSSNLPMQLFIKMDDVEYGLRSNMPVVTLNGISVWHLDFNKKYTTTNIYYTLRNTLLISKKMGILNNNLKVHLLKKIISDIFCLKYKNVEMSIFALQDYLKGYSWVSNQSVNLHTKLLSHSYIFKNNNFLDNYKVHPLYKNIVFRLITGNGIFLDYTRTLPIDNVKMEKLYGVKFVNYTNWEGYSFIERREPLKSIKLFFKVLFYFFKI